MTKGNKLTFSMSGAGGCPKAIAAPFLGYDPVAETQSSLVLMEHASRCEELAIRQIMDSGFRVEPSMLCPDCKSEFGITRFGLHVEIDELLFRLIGHLDGRIILDGNRTIPLEIKSLGRFTWYEFAKNNFTNNSGYAGQEACYLQAEKSPGIYWVLNRDNGQSLKYIINDYNNDLNLDGFTRINLPMSYDQIADNLNSVVIAVSSGELPEAEYSEDNPNCRWCRFVYLCEKKESEQKEIDLPSLLEAAKMYKEGKEYESMSDDLKSKATSTFLVHSKQSGINKYKVGGISFSYSGQQTRTYIDEKLLRELVDDGVIRRVVKKSLPFDKYMVRILKED